MRPITNTTNGTNAPTSVQRSWSPNEGQPHGVTTLQASPRRQSQQPMTSATSTSAVQKPSLQRQPHFAPPPSMAGRKRPAGETSHDDGPAHKRQAMTFGVHVESMQRPIVAQPTQQYPVPQPMHGPSVVQPLQRPPVTQPKSLPAKPQTLVQPDYQALWREQQERDAIDRAEALERERRAKRKAELSQDPDRNFHSLLETLEHWPLKAGQRVDSYIRTLLANQRMPMERDSDLGIAITYAKKHWGDYRQYPKDVTRTAQEARLEMAR